MTHMVIRCETSKKDKNALTLSTMLRSPFLFICCVFFLAVLPVMQLVASAARGAISPVLLLYVIALAAMLFVIIKQDGADFAGVTEYTFSDNNFTVKNEQGTTTTACASSTHAIGEAFRKIKDGYLDVCIAGGAEACVSEFALGGFNNMKALTRSDDLTRCSIPFDKERNGFVLGEGSGMLVLEELEHAKARGAKIYAEIAGYGATGDAYHMTSPSPTGEAAAAGMRLAYEEAGLKPEDIDYINAHGTSTGLNDKYETTAIKLALGEEAARKVAINSTKSMTGHLLGAAGSVEAIVTALSCHEDFIHATVGYKVPDPECDLDYCVEGNRNTTVNAALTNSLGFGGHNATLCLKKYTG